MAIFYFCLLYIISSVFFDIKNTAYKIYNIKQFVSSSLLSHIVCDNVVFLVKFLVVFLKIFFDTNIIIFLYGQEIILCFNWMLI